MDAGPGLAYKPHPLWRWNFNMRVIIGLAVLAAFSASAALAQGYPAEKLLTTAETVMGEKIAYPLGDALVEAAIVTLAPGETTILHRHGVPFFAYILEGEITVD